LGLSQDERPFALRYNKMTPKGKEILGNLISIRTLETCQKIIFSCVQNVEKEGCELLAEKQAK
jgi:hypothetical protein